MIAQFKPCSFQVHPPKQLVVPLAVPSSPTPAPYKVASLQHSSFQDASTQTSDDSSVGSSKHHNST